VICGAGADTAWFGHASSTSRDDLAVALAQVRDELRRSRREMRNLRRENQVLREAAEPLVHRVEACERFAFIHERRDRLSAKLLCRVLVTDGATYRAWVRTARRRRIDGATSGG